VRAVEEQVHIIRPELGQASRTALGAALAAYLEGEIPLIEWLDAVAHTRKRVHLRPCKPNR
jgi:hypothetical protein